MYESNDCLTNMYLVSTHASRVNVVFSLSVHMYRMNTLTTVNNLIKYPNVRTSKVHGHLVNDITNSSDPKVVGLTPVRSSML